MTMLNFNQEQPWGGAATVGDSLVAEQAPLSKTKSTILDFNEYPPEGETTRVKPAAVSATDLPAAAQAACLELGIIYQSTPTDGTFHTLDVEDKATRNGAGRIRLYPDAEGGQVWNHVTGETRQFWAKSNQVFTPAEQEARRQKAKAEREKAEALLAVKRSDAAKLAIDVLRASQPVKGNPYLIRKQVEPTENIREISLAALVDLIGYHPQIKGEAITGESVLVVPVSNGESITTIEMIDGAGRKPGLKDGQKSGGFWSTCFLPDGDGAGLTFGIGEGVATVLTCSKASGCIGVAALSCGNLKAVAQHFRRQYPAARIIVISDIGNGEQSAAEAARITSAALAVPVFPPTRGEKDTDFNDLAQLAGIDEVRFQLSAAENSQPATTAPQAKTKHAPFSMADLIRKEFKPIQWAVPGLLPEGLAILSGPPKIGKSWLVMDICIAVSSAGYALGYFKAEQGEALLLSLEDNERRLRSRLTARTSNDPNITLDYFHAQTSWARLDQGGLNDLDAWLKDHPGCKLVVIDTIQKVKAKPANKNGNAYENDYESYGALQRLALERQCCILLIHHNRKSDSKNEADPLEAISGSTGITGTMDTIMMLTRPRGGTGAVLTVTGRDIADAQYGLTFDKVLCGWSVSGSGPELGLQEGSNASRILDVMRDRPGQMMTVQEVFEVLGEEIKWDTVKRELYRLTKKGLMHNLHGQFALKAPVSPVSLVTSPQGHSDTSDMGECIDDRLKSLNDTSDTSDTSDTEKRLPEWGRP